MTQVVISWQFTDTDFVDGSFSVFFYLEYITGGYKMALIEVSSFPGLNTAIINLRTPLGLL